jgi:uncharacterized protein (DUF1501 family)
MLIQSRRKFLRAGLQSVTALGALGAMGKIGEINALASGPANYRALVCVFLSGGNDANNMIVPLSTPTQNYGTYAVARQSVALPQASLLPVTMPTGEVYGLHSKMPEVQSLFQQGRAALLANVGMLVVPIPDRNTYKQYTAGGSLLPVNLFSHSDQTSQWQTTAPNGISPTGWGGRMADLLQSFNAGAQFPPVVMTGGGGPFCTGTQTLPTAVPASGPMLLTANGSDAARIQAYQQLLTFDNGLQLVQSANGILSRGANYAGILSGLLNSAPAIATPFPANSSLAGQLKMVARIISVRAGLGLNRQIFFCNLGGFDTHGSQVTAQDALLQEVSQAINAFYQATLELGVDQQVTTFTNSEFGRTLMANSSGGTDHAWGSHHIAVGGSVIGGRMYGTYPTLALGNPTYDATGRGSLIPGISVDQYAATLAQWFGVPVANLPQVFPNIGNFATSNLGFLG